jgi:hypothetical protein
MKKILILIITASSLLSIKAQNENEEKYQNFWKYGKEVGLNLTELASRFVPFNLSNKSSTEQIIALKTKWYGNKRAFILNAGIDIDDNSDNNSIFLSLGYERRRHISAKWKYTTGWEAFIGTINPSQFQNGPLVGISKPYGIEYHFYNNFYISTEGRFLLGFNGDDTSIMLKYPTSIFFNMLID